MWIGRQQTCAVEGAVLKKCQGQIANSDIRGMMRLYLENAGLHCTEDIKELWNYYLRRIKEWGGVLS